MIYKQTICLSAFLQKRVCLKSSQSAEAVEETLHLCLLLCADHRQRCFTREFLVVVVVVFFWKLLCFL